MTALTTRVTAGSATLPQAGAGQGGTVDSPALNARLTALKRIGLSVLGVTLAGFGVWALCAPISGGVVASGIVKVEANRRTLTHRDGGTVARVLVHEGQQVRQGDVLLELHDVRLDATVDMVRSQLAADQLRLSRLEAQASGARSWQAPAELLQSAAGGTAPLEQAAKERAAFQARQAALAGQIDGELRQADDTRKEIDIRLHERANAGRALALMKEELSLNERLEQEQFVNRARVMGLQRAVSEYESRQLGNEAELSQARQRLSAIEARVQALRQGAAQQAAEELREVALRVADNQQRLRATADDLNRQRVLAPESGQLVNLRVNTVGSALGPREPIVDLVPDGAPLHVEVRLPLDAAADIRPGLAAELKLLTAQARQEPLMPATVVQVSADALTDERSGASYVLASLQVPPEALARRAVPMQSGMAAEVYLRVAERTPLGFLMEPVAGYFRRAFRER